MIFPYDFRASQCQNFSNKKTCWVGADNCDRKFHSSNKKFYQEWPHVQEIYPIARAKYGGGHWRVWSTGARENKLRQTINETTKHLSGNSEWSVWRTNTSVEINPAITANKDIQLTSTNQALHLQIIINIYILKAN